MLTAFFAGECAGSSAVWGDAVGKHLSSLIVVLLVVVAFAPPAGAAEACPTEVVDDVTLDADCPDGFRVVGDGVTVDLGGHTVGLILVEGDDVVVRNGTVTVPGRTAVFVQGRRAVLEELTVADSGSAAVEAGSLTTIRDSTFRGNVVAVSQFFGSGLTVEDSDLVDNVIGVSIQSGSDAVIRRNRFHRNDIGTNVWDEGSRASGTLIRGNSYVLNTVGVRIRGIAEAHDTRIERNAFDQSAASAIAVTTALGPNHPSRPYPTPGGAAGTVIAHNTIVRSGRQGQALDACLDDVGQPSCATVADDGITVLAPPDVAATMVVTGNHVVRSADHAIEAPGVTDGGGNVAVPKGPDSCVGVVCP